MSRSRQAQGALETVSDTTRAQLAAAPDRNRIHRSLRSLRAATMLADVVVLSYSVLLAWNLRSNIDVWTGPLTGSVSPLEYSGTAIVLVWILTMVVQGAYSERTFGGGHDEYHIVTRASVMTAGIVGLSCYLLQLPLSRGFVLLAFCIGTPLVLAERYVIRRVAHELRRGGKLLHSVIAVGGPDGVAEVNDSLLRSKHVGYRIVGACLPPGVSASAAEYPVPILGSAAETRRLCDEAGADTVLVAHGGYSTAKELRRIAWDLEGSNIDLVVVPSLTDVAGPRIHMRPVAGLPLLHIEPPQASEAAGFEKRLFDIVGAGLGLLLLSPLLLVVAVLIKLEDHGPVFFTQPRTGRAGSMFGCFKLRSMFVDAEGLEKGLRDEAGHLGALFKMPDDPRITRIGAFIRRFSIDELPQLLNVLRGEMSLVGPRPQQAWEVELYTDWEGHRLRVRPGMTGLWQVSGRSRLSFEEAIRLDLYYVDNWSMVSDVLIMARTVGAVLGRSGAY